MLIKRLFFMLSVILIYACTGKVSNKSETGISTDIPVVQLNLEQANILAKMPLKCMQQEYPNKLNQVLANKDELDAPKNLHPAFYGCFDWHSSVHGHWMLIKLLKTFPEIDDKDIIERKLTENLTAENIAIELKYFERLTEKSFERTYGWAWLLKLAEELHTWDNPMAKNMEENLKPLTDFIVNKYMDFLPRLYYPIRVGEHANTAFGLTFAWDFANTTGNTELRVLIEKRAFDFYMNDESCPLNWEPSGFDFLSPCLEEADLMRRVLEKDEFIIWLNQFLPQLSNPDFILETAIVSDRSDGKLIHLDGLNFSRAWCLYGIANNYEDYKHLYKIANEHISYSLPNVAGDGYEGGHWLASFALYALSQNE